MTEVWVGAIGAVVAGVGSSMAAKEGAKGEVKHTKLSSRLARQNSQFEAQQDYYYKQLEKKEKSRGLSEFRKFSTVHNYTPNYVDENTGPILPERPEFNKGDYAPPVEAAGKKKKGGFFRQHLDPAGLFG